MNNKFNVGLSPVGYRMMLAILGHPRVMMDYTQECKPITNLTLKSLIVTKSVGPFRVTGLQPAVDDLTLIMNDIKREFPEIYVVLGSAGMLCCRLMRGSASSISNHSWGTAIDLTVNGVLDRRGDNKIMPELRAIASIFNRHGWVWGAGFDIEDAMHFEVGDAKIRKWRKDGLLEV